MGSGYRVFTAGEVLTASNVQDYLMDQSVMSFADSTARATSIGTANFEEGMLSYLQDTNQLEVYNGASWASIAPTTTQGLTLISTTSFSGVSSQSLPASTFTSAYKNYQVVYRGVQSAQDGFSLRVRDAGTDLTSSVYKSMLMYNTSVSGTFQSQGSDGATSIDILGGGVQSGYYIFDINDIFETKRTAFLWRAQMMISSSNTSYNISGSGQVYNTLSYDSLTFIPASGTITGTIAVYGRNE
jgi:hypothetical protein